MVSLGSYESELTFALMGMVPDVRESVTTPAAGLARSTLRVTFLTVTGAPKIAPSRMSSHLPVPWSSNRPSSLVVGLVQLMVSDGAALPCVVIPSLAPTVANDSARMKLLRIDV